METTLPYMYTMKAHYLYKRDVGSTLSIFFSNFFIISYALVCTVSFERQALKNFVKIIWDSFRENVLCFITLKL